MKIEKGGWRLDIDLNGGRIKELAYGGKPLLGTFARIDGKKGNTHVCVPNFGDQGKELGLPFHGPARMKEWIIKEKTGSRMTIACGVIPAGKYPGMLEVEQSFELGEKFTHKVSVKNIGDGEAPVNIGSHYYWYTPQGWLEANVNGEEVCEGIRANGNIRLKGSNRINFPGLPEIILEQEGFSRAVLWSGFKEEKEKKVYDREYCCIEPVISYGEGEFWDKVLRSGEILETIISVYCR